MSEYIDVSLPIKSNMMRYPGDKPCLVSSTMSIDRGDRFNVTRVDMSVHTGTHVDAPYHCFRDGKKVHELEAHHFIGRAKVLDFSHVAHKIDESNFDGIAIQKDDIILLKTSNSEKVVLNDFNKDYVYISKSAACFLAEKKIATLGFDYHSIDVFADKMFPAHDALLGNGVVIIEGINLKDVEAGDYDIVALPLKIMNGDGAPARVMIKKVED